MSLRRSERLAATPSSHTQIPDQPTATRKPKRTTRESSTVLSTKSTGTAAHPPRSRKRPRADSEAGVNSDEEDGAVEEGIDEDDGGITDPTKIKRPIISLISPALATAWRVNQKHPMCFFFDPASPACRFKRGMVYHWGRRHLETGRNMSGTLKGEEPFTWHVSTRHISGTCVMFLVSMCSVWVTSLSVKSISQSS